MSVHQILVKMEPHALIIWEATVVRYVFLEIKKTVTHDTLQTMIW